MMKPDYVCESVGDMFDILLQGGKLRREKWPEHWYIAVNDVGCLVDHDGDRVMAIDVGDPSKWSKVQ